MLKRAPSRKPVPPEDRHLEVLGRSVPLRVVENARAKRLTLRIIAGGQLRVTIPPGITAHQVNDFVERHRGWLEERLKKLPEHPVVRSGIKIPIRGVPHLIRHEPGKRGTVSVDEEDGQKLLIVFGDERHLPRRIADFLKREARKEIEPLVAKHTQVVGRPAKAVRYKDTSSRWGSCTSDGVLSFSWRIMMAPRPVIDYLVAHEVAHLREMNHGPRFWKLCGELCPDTKRCKDWLKRNGTALQAIRFSE